MESVSRSCSIFEDGVACLAYLTGIYIECISPHELHLFHDVSLSCVYFEVSLLVSLLSCVERMIFIDSESLAGVLLDSVSADSLASHEDRIF